MGKEAGKYKPKAGEKSFNRHRPRNDTDNMISKQEQYKLF